LPKEDEFTALAVWMGKCSLIHKLEQGQFPALSRQNYQVPDLFAVFDFDGRNTPVLIEVKKTSDIKLPPFTNTYYRKLMNYANSSKLPLLIAWYIERVDLWCLFELERMEKKRTAFHIDFQTAMNNSLLGALVGDVIITLEKGSGVAFRIKKQLGTEQRDANTGKLQEFTGILEQIIWFNSRSKEVASNSVLSKFLELILYIVENDVTESEDENYVTLTYHTTKEENLFTHQLLGVMALGIAVFRDDKPSWLDVIKRNAFHMDYESVRAAASTGIKEGVVRRIIRQNPAIRPKWLNVQAREAKQR
jgi:hypothetical protein